MFSRVSSMIGQALAPIMGGGRVPPAPTGAQVVSILGPPQPANLTQDQILSDIWIAPYRGPGELDKEGCETAAQRRRYREHYRDTAIIKSAVRGKADDISCLKLTILPGDKSDKFSNMAAEFVDWAIQKSPRGSRGLIDSIYTPASIDGWSVGEKKLEPAKWRNMGRTWDVWTLAHVRSLDTTMIRLQLDQYRNLLAVVNLVRGLEYYSPDQVILYSHNPLFSNPFGLSDVRAASRAANIIEDVYKLWYLALRLYGLPFMQGKAKSPTGTKALRQALEALREGGYCVTGPEDEIEVLNLAAAAATDGFERMVHTMREDAFFAIRGAAQPFMEGDGGADAHTDTDVQQDTSDASEKGSALDVCDVINRQLIPWLVAPNFGNDVAMPYAKLGGTNWEQVNTIVGIVGDAKERCGADVSAEWFYAETGIPPARDPNDKLVSAAEKQQQQQAAQPAMPGMPAAPGAPGDQTALPAAPSAAAPQETQAPANADQTAGFSAGDDGVIWKATSKLAVRPDKFQYRRGHDKEDGTVRELPEEKFDPAKCEPLATWVDPKDDEEYVVDGHHRLAWAERDGFKRVPVKRIAAGTAEEAKKVGAELNKRSGTYSAVSTFSDAPAPQPKPAAVTQEQVGRVVEELLKEMLA